MRIFWDSEHRELVTIIQLEEQWEEMEDWEKEEHDNEFGNFVESCQDYNNGTLEELDFDHEKAYLEQFAEYTANDCDLDTYDTYEEFLLRKRYGQD